MRDYKDLVVWRRSHTLTLTLYRATESFPKSEMFGLTSQIRRAVASIPTNLAEGCGRWGDGDMGRFVQIAMGSASEVDYQLVLAKDLGYLQKAEWEGLAAEVSEIRRMLTVFYKRIRRVPQGQSAQPFAKS
ncbi:MAG: four helix bundle protein [Candidatus Korobacteraceae bacterium]